MKIAIINKHQDKVNRGAETYVSELSKRLSKNHEVDVLTKINFTKRYDVVIPTNGRLQVFVVRLLTWLTGSKMIVSGQSGIGIDDRLNLYAFPDYFIGLSDFAVNWAKKINPFVKVVKISNGVDLSKFSFKVPNLKPKNQQLKTVLAVGAFTENKRHDLTIKAISKLKDVKLIIAGSGAKKMASNNNIVFLETTNDKMPVVYRKADLLVFPTVPWESFGIVLVEAMASGLPVVANDDPIRREIVGDAGLFVDPTDIDAYAKAIERALSTNWGEKPRKQAEKFSWDSIAKQYEELFTTL